MSLQAAAAAAARRITYKEMPMEPETKASIKALKQLAVDGKIINWRRTRKTHNCTGCKQLIEPRTYCYTVVFAGSGLGSLKFPDYYHDECL